jgi:putative pyoverdin transport system ATP-binding/permease protein
MKFLRFLLQVSWQQMLLAGVTGLVSGCGNALLIFMINQSINQASPPNALLYFGALAALTLLTSIISQFFLIRLAQNAIYQLRLRLSQNILHSPLTHLEKLGTNRLLATLTEDVRFLSKAVAVVPVLCIDMATIVGTVIYLAWLSGGIFVITCVITALSMLFVQTQVRKAQQLFAVAREEEDQLFKHFQAIVSGIKEFKLHRRRQEDFLDTELRETAETLKQKNSKAMERFAAANVLGQLTQFVQLGFILFFLANFWHISVPLLASYILATTYLALPMQNLLSRMPDLIQGNVALKKIEQMNLALAQQSEVLAEEQAIVRPQVELSLNQVTYAYESEGGMMPPPHPMGDFPPHPEVHFAEQGRPPGHPLERGLPPHPHPRPGERMPMHGHGHGPKGFPPHPPDQGFRLGPISLSFQPGKITFLVGGNGSGKSTLAKLITGLYSPQSGTITLNGTLITEENRDWYREHFSAIFSDFFLFERCLGLDSADLDEEATAYLKHLQLDHKVQVKNGVFSTTQLSQGQRKRLALLIAYLEDRPVYVFDEWAADQEPQFRELFYRQILPSLKQRRKTVLVITHDDRYFHLADQLIKLDYGQVEGKLAERF